MALATSFTPDQSHLITAGLVLSNVATFFAFYFLYKLILLDWNREIARTTLWLLALFPTSFYLSAVYTEGLFLLLTILAFYAARKGSWAIAGILGAFGAATRFIGAFLILPLVVQWLRDRPRRSLGLLALFLIPLGLLFYMLYLQRMYGQPLLFVEAAAAWGRTNATTGAFPIIRNLLADPLTTARSMGSLLDLAFVLLAGVLFIRVIRSQPPAYRLYATYAIAIPLSTFNLASFSRYFVVIFPLFIALSEWLHGRPRAAKLVMCLLAYTQVIFFALWALHYWVA
jgi:hypothetical protein